MINDKSLKKAIERDIKTGVTIYNNGSDIWFIAPGWAAKTTMANMQTYLRKTLGGIMEMLGHGPELGAFVIRKKSADEYIEQAEMVETVINEIDAMRGESFRHIKPTALHYNHDLLYQAANKQLYSIHPGCPGVDAERALLNDRGYVYWQGRKTGDFVIGKATRPDMTLSANDGYAYLERRHWTSWVDNTPAELEELETEGSLFEIPDDR